MKILLKRDKIILAVPSLWPQTGKRFLFSKKIYQLPWRTICMKIFIEQIRMGAKVLTWSTLLANISRCTWCVRSSMRLSTSLVTWKTIIWMTLWFNEKIICGAEMAGNQNITNARLFSSNHKVYIQNFVNWRVNRIRWKKIWQEKRDNLKPTLPSYKPIFIDQWHCKQKNRRLHH